MNESHRNSITGLILAGGQGSRMGGQDKGLIGYRGSPLIVQALGRLAPQVSALMISANRNLDRYQEFGYPVLLDALPDYPGPLAGLHAGLNACTTPLLACVPCDTPGFPLDLVAHLQRAMEAHSAPAAWAATEAGEHPVFMLCRKELAAGLGEYLTQGGRRVRDWLRQAGAVPALFAEEAAFANFNTPEALAKAADDGARGLS